MTVEHSTPDPREPAGTPETLSAYRAARAGAALFDRSGEARLLVTGPDRASWLQGLLTNDIVALRAGEGCYAAYLTPQGRMIADVRVLALEQAMLLDLPSSSATTVRERLEMVIIMEDVAVSDVSGTVARLAVHGPAAATVLANALAALRLQTTGGVSQPASRALPDALHSLGEHESIRLDGPSGTAGEVTFAPVVAGARELGERGFDVYVPAGLAGALRDRVLAAGAVGGTPAVWEILRTEQGTPVFGRDMDETTIPLEAGIQDRAISLTKGCYVGQEVIIRVLHRGHGRVARRLVGLRPAGVAHVDPAADAPGAARLASGDVLVAADDERREVGRITTAVHSPALGHVIALGYVHRDLAEPGHVVRTSRGEGSGLLVVTATPFARAAAAP
jgi:folate-binding protein YgfZ